MGAISPTDDLFHPPTDTPYWNESAWNTFMIPDRGLSGWVYFYHRPNMKLSAGGVAIWDRSGNDVYSSRYYQWDEHQALPDGAQMYDFTLRNSLSVNCIEPQRAYGFRFSDDGCELDLTFRSILDPQGVSCAPGEEFDEWGSGHYEQPGRMAGAFAIEGERFEVDCWSIRDHSWGPRWESTQERSRGSYSWAVADVDTAFHCMSWSRIPPTDDPLVGTVEEIVGGWYWSGGVLGKITEGRRTVVDRDGAGCPLTEHLDAVDEHGRSLQAEGKSVNWFQWPAYGRSFVSYSLARWTFGGQAAWGELDEYYSLRHRRRFLSARRPGHHLEATR